jgi:hypothetical protein
VTSTFGAAPNPKAVQVGGLTASRALLDGDIGLPGMNCLATPACLAQASLTASGTLAAGAEFDHPVSGEHNRQAVGCPSYPVACEEFGFIYPLSPELAAYNLLANFFNNTSQFAYYDLVLLDRTMTPKRLREYSSGSRTVQYLDVPYLDVLYATAHRCPKKKWQNDPIIGNTSLQDLLNHAKIRPPDHCRPQSEAAKINLRPVRKRLEWERPVVISPIPFGSTCCVPPRRLD